MTLNEETIINLEEGKIEISQYEYERIKKELEEIYNKKNDLKIKRNIWTYKYINKPENIEKIKEKKREYARKHYDKNKNDEEFMKKKREKALENYYKKKENK